MKRSAHLIAPVVPLVCIQMLLTPRSPAFRATAPMILAGVLQEEPQSHCTVLSVKQDGTTWYILENYGAFGAGDTVTVVATDGTFTHCGGHEFYYLPGNSIAAWRGFDWGCGSLSIVPEEGCEMMFSPVWGSISIAGHTGFQDGDAIRLHANLFLEECLPLPECAADHCVTSPVAQACQVPVRAVTWGKLKATYR
jgi:hypothetical protein